MDDIFGAGVEEVVVGILRGVQKATLVMLGNSKEAQREEVEILGLC
jgi:hypothetical protein